LTLFYLLDTNVVSEPLRPKPNPAVMAKLQAHQEEIATATIVWHELLFGCQRLPESKKRRLIQTYLQNVVKPHIPLLSYDQIAATWHAEERTRLVSATPKDSNISRMEALSKNYYVILINFYVSPRIL